MLFLSFKKNQAWALPTMELTACWAWFGQAAGEDELEVHYRQLMQYNSILTQMWLSRGTVGI